MLVIALGVMCGLVVAGTAQAGVLNGHIGAYNDGNGPSAGAWTGTTPFDNGLGVSGTVDWSVFAPADYPYLNYTPTAGEMVYTFQLFATGSSAIHTLTINDQNAAANNIGWFSDLTGEAPTAATLVSNTAKWDFAGLDAGENSVGLAFSSIKTPELLFGLAINGGTFAPVTPLPIPGTNDIPEPASLALLGLGGLMMLRRRH